MFRFFAIGPHSLLQPVVPAPRQPRQTVENGLAFMDAILRGNSEKLEEIMSWPLEDTDWTVADANGMTLLHHAAREPAA